MAWVILLILLVQIMSCSAFLSDFNNRRHQARPLPVTRVNFRGPFGDTYQYQEQKEINVSAQLPTFNKIGTRAQVLASMATTRRAPSSTQLALHPTTGASLAIVGSSLFGMQISRLVPSGGILGTLISAAFFGNVCAKWVPNKHPLYDLCFTLFLPGSLTLLLLAYRRPTNKNEFDNPIDEFDDQSREKSKGSATETATTDPRDSISACIFRIAVPFLITSLASLLGCWLSYQCALTFQWFQTQTGICKARELARITTGCMSASYVGGSVNFMSTARIVGAPADLLGSLVTADLFTMAIYFSFLSSSLDWKWLVSMFASVGTSEKSNKERNVETNETFEDAIKLESKNEDGLPSSSQSNLKSLFLTSIPLLTSTFFIVQLANRVEDILGRVIPGTACAFIALVAPLLNSLVQAKDFWKPFSKAATVWSDFFFLSFFASIGVAANLSSALSMGPACLLFSAIALVVHVVGTVFGCLLWKKVMMAFFRARRGRGNVAPSLDLEDVWIASNAAIGGPATAATFCGQMKKRDPNKLQGRTISATVWGVVGYAIGTVVGVSMYRMI